MSQYTLLPQHDKDLRDSGLDDFTIEASRIYSEADPRRLAKIANVSPSIAMTYGPSMVIPFRSLSGELTEFARLKPGTPPISRSGKPAKYLQPKGSPLRAYFPPMAAFAAKMSNQTIALCEGEKKSLRATQAGMPTIGLVGVWSWGVNRQLIPDLAAINWVRRTVLIIFDTDSERKPAVEHASAELARVLAEAGAIPVQIRFPTGPRDANGIPGKMGVDDFIVAYGEDAFWRVIQEQTRGELPRELEDYRRDMEISRLSSIGHPGIYLDTSPPGAGKSHADIAAAASAGKSLTVVPTHKNASEVALTMQAAGLSAAAYPKLTKGTDDELQTCSNYPAAEAAMNIGLSPSRSVCPVCEFSTDCEYQSLMREANAAGHRIACHARAALGFSHIAQDRRYIAIHEDPISIFRQTVEPRDPAEFRKIADILHRASLASGRTPTVERLAGGGVRVRFIPEGERFTFDERRYWFWVAEGLASRIADAIDTAETTCSIEIPQPHREPQNAQRLILEAVKASGTTIDPDAMRAVLGIMGGECGNVFVQVDEFREARGVKRTAKRIVAVFQTQPPPQAAVWINDGTCERTTIEAILGPVENKTPIGKLPTKKTVAQFAVDVTQGTTPKRFVEIIAGVLAMLPQFRRVGIITHKRLANVAKGTARDAPRLPQIMQDRISRVEYFRSGNGRGSNTWLTDCDLLIVAGTPRISPIAVRTHLIRVGLAAAASRDGKWQQTRGAQKNAAVMPYGFAWSAETLSGKRKTVRCPGYADHDWHAAYRHLVEAELVQSIGRGRGICEHGIPVVVLSTENLGIKIFDNATPKINNPQAEILSVLSEQSPNIYILGDCSVSTDRGVSSSDIAEKLKISDRYARNLLNDLSEKQIVGRVGQRGGWIINPAPIYLEPPAAAGK